MKSCPKCQTENKESNLFCKQCGSKLSNSSFEDKKAKVLGGEKGSFPWGRVSLIIAVVVLGVVAYWIIQKSSATNPRIASQPKVAGNVDYSGQRIQMTEVGAKVENGKISIPLDVVKEKKIVRFEYNQQGVKVPLISYITQSGRIITAVGMCEPCQSTRFHIQGNKLVCNACYTEWELETLKGIQGGCLNYPPELIPSTIEKDQILIDQKVVIDWKPRV